jgi:hypothetical protein
MPRSKKQNHWSNFFDTPGVTALKTINESKNKNYEKNRNFNPCDDNTFTGFRTGGDIEGEAA